MRVRIEPSPIEIAAEVGGEAQADVITIVDGSRDRADALVRIDVAGAPVQLWTPSYSVGTADVTLMYVEETRRLFVGAKQISCVVDLARREVEHVFEHCLFWGFDRVARPGYVLETGELDCLFRALDGRVLCTTCVDPPWESTVEAAGVRFQSINLGETFLPFPDALTQP